MGASKWDQAVDTKCTQTKDKGIRKYISVLEGRKMAVIKEIFLVILVCWACSGSPTESAYVVYPEIPESK